MSCLLYQHTTSFTSTYGVFHPEIMGAAVSQIVERRDPWPTRFLHTPRVGGLQTQTVIEEFTKDRALTSFNAMAGFHFVLSINLWFSQTGLLLSRLSFALFLLAPFFSFETNPYTTDTRNSYTLLPKRVQMPRITIAAGCSRGGVAVYVLTFFFPQCQSLTLIHTQ